MAILERPVDVEEPLLAPPLVLRLPEIAHRAASDRGERHALRHVGVPEEVVRDEPGAGAEDERDAVPLRTRRQCVEEVAQRAVGESRKDRVVREVGARRPSPDLGPRSQRAADVERRCPESLRERADDALPGKRRRPVERDDPRLAPRDLGGKWLATDLHLAAGDGVAGLGLVAHGRRCRSSVSAALQEKLPVPSGSPVVGS